MSDYIEIIPTRRGHYVYRLWAADGTCLYVGCVGERRPGRVTERLRAHRNQKPWWPEVTRIEVCTLARTEDVAPEETRQITVLKPVHNKQLLGVCSQGHSKEPGRDCQTCKRRDEQRRPRHYLSGAAKRALRRRRAGPGQAPMWFRPIASTA